jgi:tetratricopeptide (TPR) repeat protein
MQMLILIVVSCTKSKISPEKAIQDLSQAILLLPDRMDYYFHRGLLYAKRLEEGKAKQDFFKFLQLSEKK